MARPRIGIRNPSRMLTVGAVAVVVAIIGGAAVLAWELRSHAIAAAGRELERLSRVLAAETGRSLQSVDVVLQSASDQLQTWGTLTDGIFAQEAAGPVVHALLRNKAASMPQIADLHILDASGKILNSSLDAPAEQRLPARTFHLWRSLDALGGDRLGKIAATMAASYLTEIYQSLSLSAGRTVALTEDDGELVAAYSPARQSGEAGSPIAFRPARGAALAEAAFEDGGTDGVARLVSAQAVPGYPLVVAAGVTIEAATAQWRGEAGVIAAAAMAVVIALALAALAMHHRLRAYEAAIGARSEARSAMESAAQIRDSEARLTRAQRIATIGSWELDLATKRVEWSAEMYRIAQLSPETFAPSRRSVVSLIHEEDRPAFDGWLDAVYAGAQPPGIEFRIRRADGECRVVHAECEIVRDDAGRTITVAGTVQDIHERYLLEEQRRELEAQLHHSQKLEALGTLAGGIAHDLNNTLVPIIALSKHALATVPEGSAQTRTLEVIYRAGLRGRDLVRQILAFSRKERLERHAFDLAAVIRDALQMLRASTPATIEITEDLAPVPPIFGDPGQLQQVVVNLVTNAAQAIDDRTGTIAVTLSTLPLTADKPTRIRLTVDDDGHGMDEMTRSRIFEPFFTTKKVGEGTGLGLSVVHGIVSGHGGQIEVESKVGVGTRFDVILPLQAVPPKASSPPSTAVA